MKRTINHIGCFASLVFLAGFASSAHATISYQISNAGLETANVTLDGTTYDGILAGGIGITKTGGSGGPSSYVSICTDFLGSLYLGSTYSYNSPVSISAAGNGVAPSWGEDNAGKSPSQSDLTTAGLAIQNAAELFYKNFAVLTTGTTDQKAALQLAVWTALYDTTGAGNILTTASRFTFDTTSSAGILALDWINALVNPTSSSFVSPPVGLLVPSPATAANGPNPDGAPPQELMIVTPVPESSTIIAGALLFLPFGLCSLKSFRKSRI
jgi:hypothetical protein